MGAPPTPPFPNLSYAARCCGSERTCAARVGRKAPGGVGAGAGRGRGGVGWVGWAGEGWELGRGGLRWARGLGERGASQVPGRAPLAHFCAGAPAGARCAQRIPAFPQHMPPPYSHLVRLAQLLEALLGLRVAGVLVRVLLRRRRQRRRRRRQRVYRKKSPSPTASFHRADPCCAPAAAQASSCLPRRRCTGCCRSLLICCPAAAPCAQGCSTVS